MFQRSTKRAIGGGNAYKLALEDRLLMLLMYYRLYIPHAFLGFIFEVDKSIVTRRINQLARLLAQVFRIPERKVGMNQDEILTVFFDATEQEIYRPKRRRARRRYYSGKKKRHTIKHQVVVSKQSSIKAVSKSDAGRVHDKRVYEKERVIVPPGVGKKGDLGYQGTSLTVPIKKPKGKPLSKKAKDYNRSHNSERMVIEHVIGKMKIFRVVSGKFRNPLNTHALIFKNVGGLYNVMFV